MPAFRRAGRSREAVSEAPPELPRWGWGFVLACAIIPVLTVGGLVPIVVGVAGATSCYRVSRDTRIPPRGRMLRCAGITAACWAATAAFLALLAAAL
ncbi:MAG TPA: hypothetical protein VGB24_21630 [Longimicrobium sp.]|jgi:hypothetical protein|uniref:hypothetical protein n=1 Tax=Longimicrobium sp. TaxID=2029185 RepID=UPI002EDAA672